MTQKITTYNEFEQAGDTKTVLQPLYVIEAMQRFAAITHGHVFARRDGLLARCGGPSLCSVCQAEQSILEVLKRHG